MTEDEVSLSRGDKDIFNAISEDSVLGISFVPVEISAFTSSIFGMMGGTPTSRSYSSLGILIFHFFARGLLRYHQL